MFHSTDIKFSTKICYKLWCEGSKLMFYFIMHESHLFFMKGVTQYNNIILWPVCVTLGFDTKFINSWAYAHWHHDILTIIIYISFLGSLTVNRIYKKNVFRISACSDLYICKHKMCDFRPMRSCMVEILNPDDILLMNEMSVWIVVCKIWNCQLIWRSFFQFV